MPRKMTVTEVPMSAWRLVPPAPDACQICAARHAPEQPHNPESLYWATKRALAGEPRPTWRDALAHVDEPLRRSWIAALKGRGVVV